MEYNLFRFFLFVVSCAFAASCEDPVGKNERALPPDNHEKVTIPQGVWGNVWFWDGNFMPTTDNSSHGTITPVEREIRVHQATRFDSVTSSNGGMGGVFFDSILTKQIATLRSDNTGFFQIELPPGKYSFFVKEDSLYYENGVDSAGHLVSASVTANSVTKRQLDITYRAAY